MPGVLSGGGTSKWEPFSLVAGVVSILMSVFFFLYKFEIVSITYEVSDTFFLYFFPTLILLSGIMHLLSTVGTFGMK